MRKLIFLLVIIIIIATIAFALILKNKSAAPVEQPIQKSGDLSGEILYTETGEVSGENSGDESGEAIKTPEELDRDKWIVDTFIPGLSKNGLTDIEIELMIDDYNKGKYDFYDNFIYGGYYNNVGGDSTLFQVDKSSYDGKSPIKDIIEIESGAFYSTLVNYTYINPEDPESGDKEFLKKIEKMDQDWNNLDYLYLVQNYGITKPEFKLSGNGEDYYYKLSEILFINGDISSKENFRKNARAKKVKLTVSGVSGDVFEKELDLLDNYEYQMLDVGYVTWDVTKPIKMNLEVLEKYNGSETEDVYIGRIVPFIDSNIASPM